jgi:hypothetical protein
MYSRSSTSKDVPEVTQYFSPTSNFADYENGRPIDLALGFVERVVLAQLLVGTTARRDMPDHFAASLLGTLSYAGVASIGADDGLVAI